MGASDRRSSDPTALTSSLYGTHPSPRLLSLVRSRSAGPLIISFFSVLASILFFLSPHGSPESHVGASHIEHHSIGQTSNAPAASRWHDRIAHVFSDTLRHSFRVPSTAVSCESIPSTLPRQFRLELCHLPSRCNEGFLRIVQLDPTPCRPPPTSAHPSRIGDADDQTAADGRSSSIWSLGPDTFRFAITGRIRASSESRPSDVRFIPSYRLSSSEDPAEIEETCAYEFPFELGRVGGKGKIGVSLEWYLRDWQDRLEDEDDPNGWKYLLSNRTSLIDDGKPPNPLSPAVFFPSQSLCPSAPDRSLEALPRRLSDRSPAALSAHYRLPPCSRVDPFVTSPAPLLPSNLGVPVQQGDFLPAPFEDRGKTYGGYAFRPRGCRWGEVPTLEMEKEEVKRRWTVPEPGGKARKILFVGDSHARYLHHYFQALFLQDRDYITSPQRTKEGFDTRLIDGHLNITYIWSAHLDFAQDRVGSCETLKGFDSFVLSAGQHFLVNMYSHPGDDNYKVNWTSTSYSDRVFQAFKWISDCVGPTTSPLRFVFVGPPAYRPPMVKSTAYDMDRRQNGRIWRWTYVAFARLKQVFPDIALVDQYSHSHPFLWDNPVDFHFFGTDAIHVTAADLSWKLRMEQGPDRVDMGATGDHLPLP